MAKNMEVEEEVEHESDAYEGDPQPFRAQHAPLECGIAQGFAAERGNEQQAIHSRQTLERASHAGEPPLTSSRCEERAEGEGKEKTFGIANVKKITRRKDKHEPDGGPRDCGAEV